MIFATLCLLASCDSFKAAPLAQRKADEPEEVTVALPLVAPVIDFREYTGRTAAIELVEVRARVGGYLDAVEFKEGSEVNEGDLLFRIDPRPFEADIRQAEANLAAQQAQLDRLSLDLSRARNLISSNAISQADLDQAIANSISGEALLKSLKAAVAMAKLDFEYTEIRSPIAGRTGRARVTPGNLVVADVSVLTSVVSTDPIYAYFDVDESSALDYRMRVRGSQVDSARDTKIEISLGLANEKGYPHLGVIDFVDNVTDVSSGNISIRGRFANTDGALLPGLFVRVRVPFTRPYDALLIPQTALAMNQQGRFVLVVDKENRVTPHVVKVGTNHGTMVSILSGLKADEQVVVNGLQKARPGSIVKPDLRSIKATSEATSEVGASTQR